MNILDKRLRLQILQCLLEGNGIRSTARITRTSNNTVMRLFRMAGRACLVHHQDTMKDLDCKNIQVDEIWSFIHSKQKNAKDNKNWGDSWTWVAICIDTKIVPNWHIGKRDSESAAKFIKGLSDCVRPKTNIISDGLGAYKDAINTYMKNANLGNLVKTYTRDENGGKLVIEKKVLQGAMSTDIINTSYIERLNLNLRMGVRRFTRKTNAFSKKIENHMHALSLYFYYYNFVRKHKTLKTTPANAMGISKELKLESILKLVG